MTIDEIITYSQLVDNVQEKITLTGTVNFLIST